MSLICETIVSEDELSQSQSQPSIANQSDEELDYEEDIHHNSQDKSAEERNESDKDEGELEDDDDLEEGEVKEDDEDDTTAHSDHNRKRVTAPDGQTDGQNRQNSICRFYGRGQCTWGNNCRFVHPPGVIPVKRIMPVPPALPLPMPPHLPPPQTRSRPNRDFYDNQPSAQTSANESAWERGLKQAKEMIVRASRRKEEEVDFEDKRFHLGVEEDANRRSRESSHSPDARGFDNDEYERRRRLAFESAPWNNEEPVGARLRAAETYRDPWRRSKSPPAPGKVRRPPAGPKRSHSMSSISASGSESSDFSGSEGSSFSESSGSERSGGRRRYNRMKTMSDKKSNSSAKKAPIPSTNWTKGEPNPNRETTERNNEYDSWSESLSESESMTSYYSGSHSESGPEDNKRIPKRIPSHNKPPSKTEPPAKRAKVAIRGPTPPIKAAKADAEAPKKSPIKMTFMKKHPNLKKDSTVSVRLNGGRNSAEEPPPDEEDELALSPGLSPKAKSISSASPVSQEPSSPPPPPAQSSSSSSGSSKYDKSLSATVSRREELLQQLKAVEDAIARKRSKIN